MSRATVRAAAALYLGGRPQPTNPRLYRDSAITSLGALWTAPMREVADDYYWPGPGQLSGAVAFVHLVRSNERRDSMGGGGIGDPVQPPAGWKRIDYQFYLECWFTSRQPRTEDAMADFDTFLDSLVDRFRADRTWGTGGRQADTIWQAGEDIDIAPGEPDLSNQRVYIQTAAQTTVTEWVLS